MITEDKLQAIEKLLRSIVSLLWGKYPPTAYAHPVTALNVRSGPGIDNAKVGIVTTSDYLIVNAESLTLVDTKGYRWVRIVGNAEEWIAESANGKSYLEMERMK